MNKDFHFYGTYAAAIIAGYEVEEAKIIAYAAQFVDDCTESLLGKIKTDKRTIMTCEDLSSNIKETLKFYEPLTKEDVVRERKIWSSFHFLPGNFEEKIKNSGKECPPDLAKMCADNFKLMCLPDSTLSKEMVKRLYDSNYSGRKKLIQIGMTMHVLADTWSHMFFAGVPEYCVNDVKMTVIDPAKSGLPLASIRWQSPVYLGHGQAKHNPDIPYLSFSYFPVWMGAESITEGVSYSGVTFRFDDKKIERDNPEIFFQAFLNMVSVMHNIKEKQEIPVAEYFKEDRQNEIKKLLCIKKADQSEEWLAYIQKLAKGSCGEDGLSYDEMVWVSNHNNLKDGKSEFTEFMEAAIEHQEFVEAFIQQAL